MRRKADMQSLLTGAGTVFAGTAAAVIRGHMELLAASVCLIFVVITQLGCNLYRCYLSMQKDLDRNSHKRLSLEPVDNNPMSLRLLREGSTSCLIISLTLGLTLMTMAEGIWWSLVVGVIIYGSCYVISKDSFVYFKWVPLMLTFLPFGPVAVMGTSLLQFQHEVPHAVWCLYDMAPSGYMGLSMGLLACSYHLVMGCYHVSIDTCDDSRQVMPGKRLATLVGLFGLLSFGVAAWMVYDLELSHPLIAIAPGVFSLVLNTHIAFNLSRGGVVGLRHYNTLAQINFFTTGLLYFILWWVIGDPNESLRIFFPI